MTRTARIRSTAALAVGLAAALLAGGCAGKTAEPTSQNAAPSPQVAGAEIPRMSADEKRSSIATSFPIEVPVPKGSVSRGEAQGEDVWDYQLAIDASAAEVATWYTTWYGKAEWQLLNDVTFAEGRKLTLVKGGYASEVTVKPAGPDRTDVTVVVGVGEPVLNTQ